MSGPTNNHQWPGTRAEDVRHRALVVLDASRVPFLIGGMYALERLAGIARRTKDLDVFVRPGDFERALQALAAGGFETHVVFRHWLGKAIRAGEAIDVIFSSGNAVAEVDDEWFAHAIPDELLGIPIRLCPPEETIWSKAYVMERERFDGADIAHLLRARGPYLDWPRLLGRFGAHWRILFAHLVLFGFVYPGEPSAIPAWVMQEMMRRLQGEIDAPPVSDRLCQGTLLSRAQYLHDVEHEGYRDGRLVPGGRMTATDVARWTAAIEDQRD
jgi:hypothetical protein